ncbi:hypothetical protein [Cryobacterium sp. 10I1]|uniref:HoxN/HupN/NixA family nickel/cobalt transporter n=1 Tax=Cryobacterium sp. 10I1 TaxID=3048578 RepID=UPI002B22E306|nr:hypothetical protein [Cryobacterium sp. 10I1]
MEDVPNRSAFRVGVGYGCANQPARRRRGAQTDLPWYAALALPVIFMAGMALSDSADGILMNRVYQWASTDPLRKVYYNLIVTGVSVFVAFFVGGMGLPSLFTDLGIGWGTLDLIATIGPDAVGPILVGGFTLVLLSAVLWSRYRTDTSLERRP